MTTTAEPPPISASASASMQMPVPGAPAAPRAALTTRSARPDGRVGRRRRWLGAVTLALLGTWLAGLIWFAQTIAAAPPPPDGADGHYTKTDAVVVWTGGRDRIETGLTLLADGAARQLFVSGVHHQVGQRDLRDWLKADAGIWACCIQLGYQAEDTRGNAAETAAWMEDGGLRSLRLVTANYHMRRSLLELRMAMPEAVIIPHPVVPPQVHITQWWLWPGTVRLIAWEYAKYTAALVRSGILVALPALAAVNEKI